MWLVLSVVTDETSPNTFPAGSCGNDGSNSKRGIFVCARGAAASATSTSKKRPAHPAHPVLPAMAFSLFAILRRLFQFRVRGRVVLDPHLRFRFLQEDVDVRARFRRLLLAELEAREPVHRLLLGEVIEVAGDEQ